MLALAPDGDDAFTSPPSPDKGERVFGGQFLAQCLAAARNTVDGVRATHSLHGYFLRPGDVDMPLRMVVERVRDGRSFSHRQVTATQRGRELFRLLASFHAPEQTPAYSRAEMPDAPAPEDVTYTYDDFTRAQTGAAPRAAADGAGTARPVDIRYVNPPKAERGQPVTETQIMWMRVREPLPAGADVHEAALAYLSDTTLVDHVPLPLGRRWQDAGFDGASLDHAMWFHRPARADEWLLFAQDVEATGAGRGLASGRFYTRGGVLVATCLQEGLLRWRTRRATSAA